MHCNPHENVSPLSDGVEQADDQQLRRISAWTKRHDRSFDIISGRQTRPASSPLCDTGVSAQQRRARRPGSGQQVVRRVGIVFEGDVPGSAEHIRTGMIGVSQTEGKTVLEKKKSAGWR